MNEESLNKSKERWYRCTKDIIVVSASMLAFVAFVKLASSKQIHAMSQYINSAISVLVPALLVVIMIRSIIRSVLRHRSSEQNESADFSDRRIGCGSFILLVSLIAMSTSAQGHWWGPILDTMRFISFPVMFLIAPFLFFMEYDLWTSAIAIIVIAVSISRRYYWQWIGVASFFLTAFYAYGSLMDVFPNPTIEKFAEIFLSYGIITMIVFLSIAGLIFFIRKKIAGTTDR